MQVLNSLEGHVDKGIFKSGKTFQQHLDKAIKMLDQQQPKKCPIDWFQHFTPNRRSIPILTDGMLYLDLECTPASPNSVLAHRVDVKVIKSWDEVTQVINEIAKRQALERMTNHGAKG